MKVTGTIEVFKNKNGYVTGILKSFDEDNKKVLGKAYIDVKLPEKVEGIIRCTNPRCITSIEQELPNVFKLTDREHRVYRCIYCESKNKKHGDIK